MVYKPVLKSEESTLAKFNAALEKARLLFENVDEHKKYQCALMYDGAGLNKSVITVMYTTNSDEIETKQISIKDNEYIGNWMRYSTNWPFIRIIRRNENNIFMEGLLRFDGEILVEPNYKEVEFVDEQFIVVNQRNPREYAKGRDYYFDKEYGVYDFDGQRVVRGLGFATTADTVSKQDKKGEYIFARNYELKQYEVYASMKDGLFRILVEPMTKEAWMEWHKNRPTLMKLDNRGNKKVVQSFKLEDLLKTAQKVH